MNMAIPTIYWGRYKLAHPSMVIKERLRWIAEEQIKIVSSSGTIRLVQRELPMEGVKAIKIFAGGRKWIFKMVCF